MKKTILNLLYLYDMHSLSKTFIYFGECISIIINGRCKIYVGTISIKFLLCVSMINACPGSIKTIKTMKFNERYK